MNLPHSASSVPLVQGPNGLKKECSASSLGCRASRIRSCLQHWHRIRNVPKSSNSRTGIPHLRVDRRICCYQGVLCILPGGDGDWTGNNRGCFRHHGFRPTGLGNCGLIQLLDAQAWSVPSWMIMDDSDLVGSERPLQRLVHSFTGHRRWSVVVHDARQKMGPIATDP